MCYVDVVRAVAHACGADVPLNEHSRDLASHLRGVDHIVFLLADGLGLNLIDRLPRNSWLRHHTRRSIHAPFPSTTTVAVTSFSTAEHPATHGVIGWWIHVPEIQSTATVFLHDRARDGRSLTDLGYDAEVLCSTPSMLPRMDRQVSLVVPADIAESPFTTRMSGPAQRLGYRTLEDAVDTITRTVQDSPGPTFTYWYTSSPDHEEHDEGVEASRVDVALARLDQAGRELAKRLSELPGSWRLVGTADHGHLALNPKHELAEDDELNNYLDAPPSGDMRVQYWHVRAGAEPLFVSAFKRRYADSFFLLDAPMAESLRLFGPEPWSRDMRRRAGTHVSISRGAASLRPKLIPGRGGYQRMRSGHSGLSPEEMLIPLIIAGDESPQHDYGGLG